MHYALPELWGDTKPGWANLRLERGQLRHTLGFVDGRAPRDPKGEPSHGERDKIGGHMARVGQQGERAGNIAAKCLDPHEAAGEQGGDADGAGIGTIRMGMRMAVTA